MKRLGARTFAVILGLGAWSAGACSVTPHFVSAGGAGGSGSTSSSGSTASSASASASTASSSATSSSSGGDNCAKPCTVTDPCQIPGACDPATGLCAQPGTASDGTSCNSGGRVCVGGICRCPLGDVWCQSQGSCLNVADACTTLSCQACGYNAACDGTQVSDPVTQQTTTCQTTLPGCSDANAINGLTPDQQRYHLGTNLACFKLNGAYGWYELITFATQVSNGCLTVFPHCGYVCSAKIPYQAFCNTQGTFDVSVSADASGDGCGNLVPLPAGYACP